MRRLTILVIAILLVGACSKDGGVTDPKLEQTARDVVAMIRGFNCERMSLYTVPEAATLWRQQITGDLLDQNSSGDPTERVCFVLGTLGYPRSETMEVKERSRDGDQVLLTVSFEGSAADLGMIKVGDEWKLDHDWALNQVQDLRARLNVLELVSSAGGFYARTKRFTDSAAEIEAATLHSFQVARGIANAQSPPNYLYVGLGPDAQSVCVSTRSKSGELFMARQSPEIRLTYARGSTLPDACPGEELASEGW